MLTQKIQDRINETRRATLAESQARKRTPRNNVAPHSLTFRHSKVTNVLQSPDYYRSFSRPSDTKAVDKFYRTVQK